MKIIKHEIKSHGEFLTILPIGDLHIGDKQHNRAILDAMLERLKTEKDTYCCLIGDLMNNATKSSVSDTYNEVLPPLDQVRECARLFGEVKDKVLFGIGGNHEARTWRMDGLDMTYLFFAQLGIEERYSDTTAVMFLKTGAQKTGHHKGRPLVYSMYATHGNGGGRKWGGKINRLTDYAGCTDVDIYLCGHSHSPAVVRQSFFRTDTRYGTIEECDKLFVNSAACLDYGGYADTAGFTPPSKKYPQILLNTGIKRAEAIL